MCSLLHLHAHCIVKFSVSGGCLVDIVSSFVRNWTSFGRHCHLHSSDMC